MYSACHYLSRTGCGIVLSILGSSFGRVHVVLELLIMQLCQTLLDIDYVRTCAGYGIPVSAV